MSEFHYLPGNLDTANWGVIGDREPVLTVESGDIVKMESISHRAGDLPDLMMDEGVQEIYDNMGDRGPGKHIVTGPVHINGVKKGGVLKVNVLDLVPRLPYGSNMIAGHGILNDDFDDTHYIVAYEVDEETYTAKAMYYYEFNAVTGEIGEVIDTEKVEKHAALENLSIPLNLHLGIAAVAPKDNEGVSTTPPGYFGGNVDNRSFVRGTTMYYPVHVDGGHFYVGDSHFAEGDGEVNGTALEAHVNATLQFEAEENLVLEKNPVLETPEYWYTHGFNEDLEEAFKEAGREAIAFMKNNFDINEVEAYSLLSLKADFHATQLVNGVKGAHCRFSRDFISQLKK